MISQVYEAIADFLHTLYPEYDIYPEYPPNDFEPPAFVVMTTGGNMVRRLSDDTIHRGIDYQNYIIYVFNQDIFELVDITRDIKVRLQVLELKNGEAYRVMRKNSNVNTNEHTSSITFTIAVSEVMKYKEQPKFQRLSFEENFDGAKIKQDISD